MKRSESFIHTRRERPRDAESRGYGYLVQAGMVEPLGAGIFQYAPTGTRVVQRVEQIMREEMNGVGGQEVRMPVVHPAELWERSGRLEEFGPELLQMTDRRERRLLLAPTHEETITDMADSQVQSYRDLPFMLYQIQTKFRDEPRARGGLIRVREFTMKDAYSFHEDASDLDDYYPRVRDAYMRIFNRCGLSPELVEADPGVMGGGESHEFMLPAEIGEDHLASCESCGYARNMEDASFERTPPAEDQDEMLDLEEAHTPDCRTITDVAGYLDTTPDRTAKAVFYRAPEAGPYSGRLVFAIIRGDLDIDEVKLQRVLQTHDLEPAGDDEIQAVGAVPGFASPLELGEDVAVIADPSIEMSRNLVAGANRTDYHLENVNYGRDFEADLVEDIAEVPDGAPCVECGSDLSIKNCIELGHIFKLGTRYSSAMDATFQDEEGNQKPFVMGCYGIGPDRLLAAVAETWNDDNGLCWPPSIAPFEVVVLPVGSSGGEQEEVALRLYNQLNDAGVDVLLDDRQEQSGVKFNDAELLGIPLFVIVGPRGLEAGQVDLQRRLDGETRQVDLDGDLPGEVREELEVFPG